LPKDHKKPIYEVHDYSAVESYVAARTERARLSNKALSDSYSLEKLKNLPYIVVSAGVATLLILYGVSLLNEERIKFVEKEIVVEKPVIIEKPNDQTISLQSQLKDIRKKLETRSNSNPKNNLPGETKKNTGSGDKLDVSQKITIFHSVSSGMYGFKDVVTGLNYVNSKSEYPNYQYCYIEFDTRSLTKKHITLASKNNSTPIEYVSYSRASSELSPSQFTKSKKMCIFLK
jgi:hypothetical protein